jgi:NAD(P)-dependent dehydrogenase (short-subunit alcohol dehydrogenase family)
VRERAFLAGRTPETLDALAAEIVSAGGHASTAQVDATDPRNVEDHFASVVDQTGGVDVSFNVIALRDVQGQELAALPLDDFMRPVELAARSQFIPRPLPPDT